LVTHIEIEERLSCHCILNNHLFLLTNFNISIEIRLHSICTIFCSAFRVDEGLGPSEGVFSDAEPGSTGSGFLSA